MRKSIALTEFRKTGLWVIACLSVMLLCGISPYPAQGLETGVNGLTFNGYLNQSTNYSFHDTPDTMYGFNSFLTQGLFETRYQQSPDLVFFNSLKLNADWAYPIYSGNSEWIQKGFSGSRDSLFILDKPRDFIGEAHVTWKPNDEWYFRVGKQIVQWGETDGFVLMNQINPIDQRRGIGDVQFENTIVPIWLLRSEYKPPIQSTWLTDPNIQFIFNPNVDFAQNYDLLLGNDKQGVWAPYVAAAPGVLLGSYNLNVSSPKAFDPQGDAFALRLSGVIADTRITLNGYYGRSHDMVLSGPTGATFSVFQSDPRWLIVHPAYDAYYPYFRFVGTTFSRDIDFLKSTTLGGVAPVLRFEGLHAFNSTFSTDNNLPYYQQVQGNNYWTTNEDRAMAGLDWKIKVNALNPRAYFFISGQVYGQHLEDYPSTGHVGNYVAAPVYQNEWMTSLLVSTTYLHNKLQPQIFWLKDWTTKSEFYKPQIAYEYSDRWKYTLGAILANGQRAPLSFQALEYKDQVFFTVSYRF